MKREQYQIAGERIEVCSTDGCPISMFRGFEVDACAEIPCVMSMDASQTANYFSGYGLEAFAADSSYPNILRNSSGIRENLLFASKDWSRLKLYGDLENQMSWMELLAAAFYSRMCAKKTLFMHASAVEYQGKAIVFTAASGTGKTTQAELWHKYCGARILNGDKVFIRKQDGAFMAWGSPWKGSSPYGVNDCAKTAGVVVLRQAKENRIRRLNELEIMEYMLPHVFYPGWDEACVSQMTETLDGMISQVPVYLLECRPDKEAVDLAAQQILGLNLVEKR